MTRADKISLVIVNLILLVAGSAWITLRQLNWALFEKRIPPQFEIVDRVLQHTELLGSCGIAVFQLSDTTLEKIKSQGQAFLTVATVARAPHEYPYESYSRYASWQPTPIPAAWRNGDASWMPCHPFPSDTVDRLVAAATKEGSYYTSAPDNQKLVLAPRLGIIVYSYFD